MRTTIDIHDPLLQRAKQFAAGQGKNLADVVNDALLEKLGREERAAPATLRFHMPTFGHGGTRPGIDLDSHSSVQDALDRSDQTRTPSAIDLDRLR